MGARKSVSRRRFGAGSFARRHDQGFQALTGALVMGGAIGVLTLHHFGFGIALLIALAAAVVCVAVRTGAAAGSFVVLAALFAGVVATPHLNGTPDDALIPAMTPISQTVVPETYELYVLEPPERMQWDADERSGYEARAMPGVPQMEPPRVVEL